MNVRVLGECVGAGRVCGCWASVRVLGECEGAG